MSNLKYPYYALVATLFFAVTTASCSDLGKGVLHVGDLFKGNTKKDIVDYNLEEKSEYRKYQYHKHIEEREENDEIIMRLEVEDERMGKKKSSKRKKFRSTQKKNVFQKILKKHN